jgi:hypothetical protein
MTPVMTPRRRAVGNVNRSSIIPARFGATACPAIGDGNPVLDREMETAGFALAAIDVDHRRAEAGRQLEAIDGAPLDVVGDNELKQGAPIRPTRDPAQLDWRAALGEVARAAPSGRRQSAVRNRLAPSGRGNGRE